MLEFRVKKMQCHADNDNQGGQQTLLKNRWLEGGKREGRERERDS